jgi:hypothetical protein
MTVLFTTVRCLSTVISIRSPESPGTSTVPALIRVAAFLHWIIAVGLGVFCVPAIRNLLIGHDIPTVMGFPTYGRGPFEHVGIPTTVLLLAAFLLVCILEAVAGVLLWGGRTSGAVLALVLLPVGAAFWWGFALPIPPIFALVWTILILLNWQALR